MSYATQAQMVERYSEDAVVLISDRDEDGQIDALVVEQALGDASAEIDSYLAARYVLPLVSTPEVLVRLCVDIAMYRLAAEADIGTEERRQRYEDAIALLLKISKGDAGLVGATELPPAGVGATEGKGAVVVSGPGRRFSRDSMKGIR